MEIYDLGDLIKKLRKQHNMSQQQLAARLHITDAMVSRYESNISVPPFDTLCSIAGIFNVSMDDLCGMKHQGMLSAHGLTESQTETVRALIESYRFKNAQTGRQLTQEQFAVLGQIVAELTK